MKRFVLAALLLSATAASQAQDVEEPEPRYVAATIDAPARGAAEAINRFTLDLFKRVGKPGDNLFLSPASVSTALALTYRGAKGETADQLRRVLYYTAPPETYLSAQAPILTAMSFTDRGRQLRTSNALWFQTGMPLAADYAADVQKYAGAGLNEVDYRTDPQAARLTINRWVASATNGRIKDLLGKGDVTDQTRMTLVNTIYWKGRWSNGFNPRDTRTEPFRRLDGGSVNLPLMHQTSMFRVLERDGVKAIDLPYGPGEVSMTVLMPDRASALPRFEQLMTSYTLAGWLNDLDSDSSKPRKTILTLPKLHVEWRGDLVDTFKAMGVTAPFGDGADFSGMATLPYPGEVEGASGLSIEHIIHQTWLDLDEQGSEAAAATAVLNVVITSARRRAPEPPPFVFRADKPFLFVLRDHRTKMILFIGRYTGLASAD